MEALARLAQLYQLYQLPLVQCIWTVAVRDRSVDLLRPLELKQLRFSFRTGLQHRLTPHWLTPIIIIIIIATAGLFSLISGSRRLQRRGRRSNQCRFSERDTKGMVTTWLSMWNRTPHKDFINHQSVNAGFLSAELIPSLTFRWLKYVISSSFHFRISTYKRTSEKRLLFPFLTFPITLKGREVLYVPFSCH